MRKVHILSAALLAMLAFGVVSATASAASPEWLDSGKALAGKELAVTEGKWELLGLGIFGVKLRVTCNGKLIGTVGPGAEDLVTEATDLSNNKLITCEITRSEAGLCELPSSGNGLALVEAEHLPWKTELLLSGSEIIDHFKSDGNGLPAFDVRCLLSGGSWSLELCEGEVLTKGLVNLTGGVMGSVLNQLSAKCNNSSNVAHIFAEGETKLGLLAGTLEVK